MIAYDRTNMVLRLPEVPMTEPNMAFAKTVALETGLSGPFLLPT